MIGIDCSNWGGVPSPETGRALRAAGVEFAIVGTQNEDVAREQLQCFKDAGIRVDVYYYPLYDNLDGGRIDRARRLAQAFGCEYIWDDVEWSPGDGLQPPAEKVAAGITARVGALMSDFRVGIYSSETQWPSMTRGLLDRQIDPAVTPLWSAFYYYDRRVPDFRNFRPYGAWASPLIWQWHDTVSLAGFSVDLNLWNPAHLPTAPGPPPAPRDETLDVVPGREGIYKVGGFQVLYNAGVPIWRYGGQTPGATAKNFGGQWIYLRNPGDGSARWTAEEGD